MVIVDVDILVYIGKYSDFLFAISALPYFLLLCTILCYTIFDIFYILLGDDPMLLDQLNKINK
jgi:hypothetical protein